MANLTELDKYNIYIRLNQGLSPREVSEELNISYPTVLRHKKIYQEAILNNSIRDLLSIDKLVLQRIAEEVKDEIAEKLLPVEVESDDSPGFHNEVEAMEGELITELDKCLNGIDGLQVLADKFQDLGYRLADKITLLLPNAGVDGTLTLVDALSKLQNAFFNRNSVNVNVLQTNGETNISGDGLTKFRSLQRS